MLLRAGDADVVSVRAIAREVGVTPPALYLHFADKDALLFAVCEHHFGELERRSNDAAGRARDPIDGLRARGRAYLTFGVENPEHYRVLFMTRAAAAPAQFSSQRLPGMAVFTDLVAAVQHCIDAGGLRPSVTDAHLVATGLWAAVHGLTSLLISHPGFPWPPVDRLVDHVLATQLDGLRDPG